MCPYRIINHSKCIILIQDVNNRANYALVKWELTNLASKFAIKSRTALKQFIFRLREQTCDCQGEEGGGMD